MVYKKLVTVFVKKFTVFSVTSYEVLAYIIFLICFLILNKQFCQLFIRERMRIVYIGILSYVRLAIAF